MRMKMTKRHHVCDETCEPEGTGIHNVKSNAKKTKKVAKKPKVAKKFVETDFGNVPVSSKKETKTKPEVVNVYKLAPKTDNIIEIMNIVEEIANENETNKVLEKTLITLRKLQKDIA